MRVTTVQLYSSRFTEPIDISLRDIDPSSQYSVRTIIGLDAEDIVHRFYGWGSNTGLKFYDFKMKPRDIVMRIVLNPRFSLDESYSDIRDELYRAISADRTGRVVLHFKSGATIVSRIYGMITKFEVPYFTKLPEVQLTIQCHDPFFRAINPVIFESSDLPAANPVNIPDSLSTSPHGFELQVTFTAASPSFTIQDAATDPEWQFKVTPSGGFLTGDVLHISTEFTNRYVYIVRGGSEIQLVDKIEPTSIWPVIFPGQNTFYFFDKTKFNWNFIEYYASYWGV